MMTPEGYRELVGDYRITQSMQQTVGNHFRLAVRLWLKTPEVDQ